MAEWPAGSETDGQPIEAEEFYWTHTMYRLISLCLFLFGVMLVVRGMASTHSIQSYFALLLTDSPNGQPVWLLIGGIVMAIIGSLGVLRRSARIS